MKKKAQQILIAGGGLALGVGLCIALYYYLNMSFQDIKWLSSSFSLSWVFGIAVLSVLLMLTGAFKWRLLAESLGTNQGVGRSFPSFLRHYLWQNWVAQFVPPIVALVVGRGVADRRHTSFGQGAMSALLDQALEFLFWIALIPAALVVVWGKGGWGTFLSLSALGLLAAGWIGYRLFVWRWPALKALAVPLLFWSMVRVLLTNLRLVWGALALGLPIQRLSIAAAGPLVVLLALIPLTPGNLGVAEWGWVGVLAKAGEDPVQAGMLALGFRLVVLFIQGFLLLIYEGGLFLLKKKAALTLSS